nr:hypothetical protein [Tanacetum cinerariifolium]
MLVRQLAQGDRRAPLLCYPQLQTMMVERSIRKDVSDLLRHMNNTDVTFENTFGNPLGVPQESESVVANLMNLYLSSALPNVGTSMDLSFSSGLPNVATSGLFNVGILLVHDAIGLFNVGILLVHDAIGTSKGPDKIAPANLFDEARPDNSQAKQPRRSQVRVNHSQPLELRKP